MGLRCLLSHDFGEPELEREREEQGNEVVITVNEVKTCTRCGERRIVSENTEVTSMEQLTATATGDDAAQQSASTAPDATPAAADASTSTDASSTPADAASSPDDASTGADSDIGVTIDDSAPTTDDAEVLTDDDGSFDDEPQDLGTAETANMTVDDVEAAAAEAADAVETADATEDDGVILSDDEPETDAEPDREPGEWPEYDTDDDAVEETPWPDVEDDDEGFSAEEPADEEPEDMTFGGGFTPEITKSESESAPSAEDRETELSFTRAEESTVEYEPTVDDIETEFYCPECGLARHAGNSSMRAGDICPDCKRGYISERPT